MYKTIINFNDGFSEEVITNGKAEIRRDDYDYVILGEDGNAKIFINDNTVKSIVLNVEEDKELVYDQDEAVKFISKCIYGHTTDSSEAQIRMVLNTDEDYMRSKGIIED